MISNQLSSLFKSPVALILWTVLTFFVTPGMAQAPFSTDLGFNSLSSPQTSLILNEAASSVFDIRVLSGRNQDDIKVVDLMTPTFQAFEKQLESDRAMDLKEKIIIQKQIENCRHTNTQNQCVLIFRINRGTAFLAGNAKPLLWTNAHLVNDFLQMRASLAKKTVPELLSAKGRLALFLFNSKGQLVFNPYQESAVIDFVPGPSKMATSRGTWYAQDSDFVGISLSQDLGKALPLGPHPNTGQTLFRFGYPECTGCSNQKLDSLQQLSVDRGQNRNSTGGGLYWTKAEALPLSLVNLFVGADLSQQYDVDQMIFLNADSQSGFSGGPILDEKGQVVGMNVGAIPKVYGDNLVILSLGVRPLPFD